MVELPKTKVQWANAKCSLCVTLSCSNSHLIKLQSRNLLHQIQGINRSISDHKMSKKSTLHIFLRLITPYWTKTLLNLSGKKKNANKIFHNVLQIDDEAP